MSIFINFMQGVGVIAGFFAYCWLYHWVAGKLIKNYDIGDNLFAVILIPIIAPTMIIVVFMFFAVTGKYFFG